MTTRGGSLTIRGEGYKSMSSHDEHNPEKEPIILTSPRRMAKGLAIVIVTLAVGASIIIPFFNDMYKNPPLVAQIKQPTNTPATPSPPAEAGTTAISILQGASAQGSQAFKPDPAEVPVGNKVVWQNEDSVPHTATSGTGAEDANKGKLFDTSYINPGDKSKVVELTGAKAGDSIQYFCTVHPYMKGTIKVTAAQAGGQGGGETSGTSAGPTIKILAGASAQGSQAFDPKELTAKKGDTVQVVNQDTVPHTVTSGKDPNDPNKGKLFDTSYINGGESAKIDLSKVDPGEYDYFCSVHPYMQGKMKVE
jgi:plastocyanin